MSDDDAPVKSPAPRWAKTVAASVFLLIWLTVMIVDWYRGTALIPFWFQATGLVVLGYLLGISFDDVTRGGGRSGK